MMATEGDAYFISETYDTDELGQKIPVEVRSEPIPCRVESIGQREFFSAGQEGLRSDIKIVTQAVNYNGEKIIEYEGQRYGIYRPYRNPKSDEIELYCEWKGGISE